jgi:hypothetical protein
MARKKPCAKANCSERAYCMGGSTCLRGHAHRRPPQRPLNWKGWLVLIVLPAVLALAVGTCVFSSCGVGFVVGKTHAFAPWGLKAVGTATWPLAMEPRQRPEHWEVTLRMQDGGEVTLPVSREQYEATKLGTWVPARRK